MDLTDLATVKAWLGLPSAAGPSDDLLTQLIAAVSAWSARETYRMPLKSLGERGAAATPKGEYDQQREVVISQSRWRKAA